MSTAAERWGDALRSWAIPQEILDAAPESPWGFPVECFRPFDTSTLSPTHLAVADMLPAAGSLIDIGSGGGAGSVPLASRLSRLVAVDEETAMLEDLRGAASLLNSQLEIMTVQGTWPCALPAAPVDVAVCANVLYNVADIEPFLSALEAACTRRVVVEITSVHPIVWMNDLWMRFHGLPRPEGPNADDAVAVIEESGVTPARIDHPELPVFGGFSTAGNAVAFIRKRLCLPVTADEDVAGALGDRLMHDQHGWHVGPAGQERVTLWWEPRG